MIYQRQPRRPRLVPRIRDTVSEWTARTLLAPDFGVGGGSWLAAEAVDPLLMGTHCDGRMRQLAFGRITGLTHKRACSIPLRGRLFACKIPEVSP
jgi:hypothetical protein